MPAKIYRIKLSSDERTSLEAIRDRGLHKSSKYKRAVALLLCNESPEGEAMKDADIAANLGVRIITIERLRKRCCEVGPLEALEPVRRETPPREIKVTGEVEAHITRIACCEPPEGCKRWTLALIAEEVVELEVIESISASSVAKVLKKVNSNLGRKKVGASRPNKMRPL